MLPGREYTAALLFEELWSRRWLIIIPLCLGILGGLLVSRFWPDAYRSDALIQVVPQRVPEAYVQSTVTTSVDERVRSLSQQVLSRTQLETVILELDLYPEERQKKPMQDVVILMADRVKIAPVATGAGSPRQPQVDAFRISFDYGDPKITQQVVQRLAGFFIDRNALERGQQADQTSRFLEAQLAEARGRLEDQEKKLEGFRQRNSGRLPTQMQANMQAIQNTQMALQAMVESLARDRDRKLVLERLYRDFTGDLADATEGALASPDPATGLPANATPRQRLEAARKLLEQLEMRLTPKHPDVVRTKRMVEDLERLASAEELERPLAPDTAPALTPEEARRRERLRETRSEIESLERQIVFKEGEEKRMRDLIGQYQARLEAVPGIESEWIALTRDYDTLQAAYRELLSKSENSKLSASLEERQIGEQFRVLDPPTVPLRPVSPNRLQINAIGVAAGLALGLLLFGLVEVRDKTMRTSEDVVAALGLPVLALVPFVPTAADRRREKRRKWLAAAAGVTASVGTGALFWFMQLWKFVV